jgi:hypothetical protein
MVVKVGAHQADDVGHVFGEEAGSVVISKLFPLSITKVI